MILRYAHRSRRPTAFLAMTGLRVAAFDTLVADLLPGYAAAEQTRLQRPMRERAVGAGHPFALAPRDQLLLAVVWLRVYPTHAVLGYLFGVSDTTVTRTVARWLPLLEAAGRDTMRLPDPGRKHRRHLDALLADTPALAVIVDTFEQRVQRPRDRDAADRLYSGKKKQHTLKVQLTIDEVTGGSPTWRTACRGRPPTSPWRASRGSWPAWHRGSGSSATGATPAWASGTRWGRSPGASHAGATGRRRMSPITGPSPGGGSPWNTPSGRCAASSPSRRRIGITGATIPPASGPWPG